MFHILHQDPEQTNNFNPIPVNQFNQPTGPNLPVEFDCTTTTPVDYFNLFLDDSVWERIVENTNKYQKYVTNQKPITRPEFVDKFWEDVTVPQLKAYHGDMYHNGSNWWRTKIQVILVN